MRHRQGVSSTSSIMVRSTRAFTPSCTRGEVEGLVVAAHACWAQPDVFAFVELDDDNALADTVLMTFHAIPGIRTTETHLVALV